MDIILCNITAIMRGNDILTGLIEYVVKIKYAQIIQIVPYPSKYYIYYEKKVMLYVIGFTFVLIIYYYTKIIKYKFNKLKKYG